MSQASATKLISKLRYKISDRRRLRNPEGPKGRHDKIKKTLTALLKYERIELNYHRADESRGYAERIISEAIRHGDTHQETMEMASYWIIEPPIIHKLFKVLVPRYKFFDKSYTKMWRAPNIYPGHGRPKCILELRNNIYPPLESDESSKQNLIHNVLLSEAKKAFEQDKQKTSASQAAEALNTDGSQVKASEQAQAGDENVELEKIKMANRESQEFNEENLTAYSESERSEMNSLESDLSKVNITEEKPKETFSEDEKK